MNKDIIFIYIEEKNKIQEIDRTNPRIDWDYPYNPPGKVKVDTRKSWTYRSYGITIQTCLFSANYYTLQEISSLEQLLEKAKSRLLSEDSVKF